MTTHDALAAARETFSGKSMTETQIIQANAIATILHAEIHRSGSFREGLTDYAHAFARNQKFDALKAEAMIRDAYSARQGQTLNQTREALLAATENLPDNVQTRALAAAETIGPLISDEQTRPFYQAYDMAAMTLASDLGVTQSKAKTLKREAFKAHDGRDLYDAGKEIEEAYHRPARQAEIATRKAEQTQSRSQSRSYR